MIKYDNYPFTPNVGSAQVIWYNCGISGNWNNYVVRNRCERPTEDVRLLLANKPKPKIMDPKQAPSMMHYNYFHQIKAVRRLLK